MSASSPHQHPSSSSRSPGQQYQQQPDAIDPSLQPPHTFQPTDGRQQPSHEHLQNDHYASESRYPTSTEPPNWSMPSSSTYLPFLQEDKRLGTAGSGSLDHILHSRGAGAFDDEGQQQVAPRQGSDRDSNQVQSRTWGKDLSASTALPRATQALPSPAETLSSGVSWGPPPMTDGNAHLRSQYSLYPPMSNSHTPLPSLANDPRFYAADQYSHYPLVNLGPGTAPPPPGPGDAHDPYRYQGQPSSSSMNPAPPADYNQNQPPHLSSYDGSADARSTLSALTPPPSNHASGASSRDDDDRSYKRPKHEVAEASANGVLTTVTGKVLKTDRPFGCDVCPQSFNRRHDLTRHHRTHEEDRPWPCTNCTKAFTRKDALRRHLLVKKECGLVVELPKSAAAMRREREARKQTELSKRTALQDEADDPPAVDLQQQQSQPQQTYYDPQRQQLSPHDSYLQHRVMPAPIMLPSPPINYADQQQQQSYAPPQPYAPDGRYPTYSGQDGRYPQQIDLSYESPRYQLPAPPPPPQQQQQQLARPTLHHRDSDSDNGSHHLRQGSNQTGRGVGGGHPGHSRQSSVHSIRSGHSMHPPSNGHSLSPGGRAASSSQHERSPHQPMANSLSPHMHPRSQSSSHSPSGYPSSQEPQQGSMALGSPAIGSQPLNAHPSPAQGRAPYAQGSAPADAATNVRLPPVPALQYSSHSGGDGQYHPQQQPYPYPPPSFGGYGQQQQAPLSGQAYQGTMDGQQQQQWYPPPLMQPFQEGSHQYLGAQS